MHSSSLVRCLARGCFVPRRAGGAVERGEAFYGGCEISHRFFLAVIQFVSS